ncbi:hypothetical protein Efla_007322 [Eimeria flavescens]
MDSLSQQSLLGDWHLDKSAAVSSGIKNIRSLNESHVSTHGSGAVGPQLTAFASFCKGQSCKGRDRQTALLVALAFVTVILFFISVCRMIRNDGGVFLEAARRLSGTGNYFESSQAVLMCSDAEGESDESTSTEASPPLGQVTPTPPKAKRVKMTGTALTAQAGFSTEGEDAWGTHTEDDQQSTRTGMGRRSCAGQRVSNHSPKNRKQPASSGDQRRPSMSAAEVEAADALLMLQQPHDGSYETSEVAVLAPTSHLAPTPQALPGKPTTQLPPPMMPSLQLIVKEFLLSRPPHKPAVHEQPFGSSGLGQPSALGASAEGDSPTERASQEGSDISQGGKQSAHKASDEEHRATKPELRDNTDVSLQGGELSTNSGVSLHPGGVLADQDDSDSAAQEEQPRLSSSAQLATVDRPIDGHPFYRIPAVNPSDKAMQRFYPERTASFSLSCRRLPLVMEEARQLLVRDSLTSRELDLLNITVQQLMAYGYYHEGLDLAKQSSSRVCYTLGRRFLLVDTVIAGLQVLGVTPNGPWWDQFTTAVSHEVGSRPGWGLHNEPRSWDGWRKDDQNYGGSL